MDWNKPFLIKNIAGGRLVVGALSLSNLEEKEINPLRYSEKAIERLMGFHAIGQITATNDFESTEYTGIKEYSVDNVKTVKNASGETNNHVVFNPNKAISVTAIENGKSIEVGGVTGEFRAIEFEYSEIDKIEAKEFLEQHWKKVQSEVSKITNKKKLGFYLLVAREWAVADKKIEMLENRIDEL